MKFLLILVVSLSNCIRFKYDNLSPALVTKIKLGENLEQIESIYINNVITNVPWQIPLSSEYLFVADFNKSIIKLFDYNGNLEHIIGNISLQKKEQKIEFTKLKLGSIGLILPGANDDVFIENRTLEKRKTGENQDALDPFESLSGAFDPSRNEGIKSSAILHISIDGKTNSTLGQNGLNSEPFEYIEKLFQLEKNQLGVLHTKENNLMLSIFKNDEFSFSIDANSIQPTLNNEENMNISLDTIIPHISGEYSLLSFKYLDKKNSRFKFRRIFKYIHQKKESVLLKEIQDPAEVLFAVKDNNDFFIWETETNSNSIRLQLHDKSGYHFNNKRIVFPPPRTQWRETYIDAEDNLYSIRIRSGNLELYKWN